MIQSRDPEFKNRVDAAERLAERLTAYKGDQGTVVLGIPRGGVVISSVLARLLDLSDDVILTKKIGHPSNSEYAIGSVSLTGEALNQEAIQAEGIPQSYIEREISRIRKELWRRYGMYRGLAEPVSIRGKTVIICDDGAATGMTILSAIDVLRRHSVRKTAVAIPVCPPQTVKRLRAAADEIIFLEMPDDFYSIGQYYWDFTPVTDEDVIQLFRGRSATRR